MATLILKLLPMRKTLKIVKTIHEPGEDFNMTFNRQKTNIRIHKNAGKSV